MNQTMQKIKAVIYCRIPVYEGYKATLEIQKKICEQYCSEQEFEVAKIFTEKAEGLQKSRATIIELTDYVLSEQIDVVVCTEWTRLYRDPIQYKKLRMELEEKNVAIHLCADDFNNSLMAEIYDGIPPKTKS
jgi:DNA invertase Pin-like site-specific DNA recombinase